MEFYGALDEFVSVETDRRNEGAKWSFWYREFAQDNAPPTKEIEAKVTVSPDEVPLAPSDEVK